MARRRGDFGSVLRQAKNWPVKERAALVEALLTPELRLRLLVGEVRGRVRPRAEGEIDRAVNQAVRRARRAKVSGR